ncbi:MAG: UbiA family prenyltransferase [Candidatus Bathyarchaeia archaeon]
MVKISGLLRLLRPVNCIVMSFAVLVGVGLAGNSSLHWLNLVYGAITAFTLTGAAMAVNDYYDFDIDKINEPSRPIPSGAVSLRAALVLTGFLTAVGLVSAFVISVYCFLFAFAAWVIMMVYSTVGKRRGFAGNLLVSACVAAPFLFGSLVAVNLIRINILLFASMAFLSNTGREIAKGIVDVQGDSLSKIRTLAVTFGERKAAYAAAAFFIFAVCLSPLPLIFRLVSVWFVPFVLVTDVGLVWCSARLIRNPSRENARQIKKIVLLLFVFGLLAFIFGKFG